MIKDDLSNTNKCHLTLCVPDSRLFFFWRASKWGEKQEAFIG